MGDIGPEVKPFIFEPAEPSRIEPVREPEPAAPQREPEPVGSPA